MNPLSPVFCEKRWSKVDIRKGEGRLSCTALWPEFVLPYLEYPPASYFKYLPAPGQLKAKWGWTRELPHLWDGRITALFEEPASPFPTPHLLLAVRVRDHTGLCLFLPKLWGFGGPQAQTWVRNQCTSSPGSAAQEVGCFAGEVPNSYSFTNCHRGLKWTQKTTVGPQPECWPSSMDTWR